MREILLRSENHAGFIEKSQQQEDTPPDLIQFVVQRAGNERFGLGINVDHGAKDFNRASRFNRNPRHDCLVVGLVATLVQGRKRRSACLAVSAVQAIFEEGYRLWSADSATHADQTELYG